MKILIAEDDLTSRVMLQALLSKWGYEVTSASDGDEAWNILQSTDAPRLAILDWVMPGMDGPTLCKKLRAQERSDQLYLLLLTSKGESNDIVVGLHAGADDYVAKPFESEELRARIEVGKRVLELMDELARREKLQGVLGMAGAVCHEMNQPLHVVLGYSEMLLTDLDGNDPRTEMLGVIKTQIDRIGELTSKMMRISQYQTKDYMGGLQEIVDIERASRGFSRSE